MSYQVDWENATAAYAEWTGSDKARLAGRLYAECRPTEGSAEAFLAELGQEQARDLAQALDTLPPDGVSMDGE